MVYNACGKKFYCKGDKKNALKLAFKPKIKNDENYLTIFEKCVILCSPPNYLKGDFKNA